MTIGFSRAHFNLSTISCEQSKRPKQEIISLTFQWHSFEKQNWPKISLRVKPFRGVFLRARVSIHQI